MITKHLTCKYCIHYQIPEKVNKLEGFRICKKSKKVDSETRICDAFITAQYYLCEKQNFRTSISICNNRRYKKEEYCPRCRQYANILKELIFT